MSVLLNDWYTDSVDIYRVISSKDGGTTRDSRELVAANIPCRVYQSAAPGVTFGNAADITGQDMLGCDTDVDIQRGDELIITRGAASNPKGTRPALRYFAGNQTYYYDDFADIDHQEIAITYEERVD